MTVKGINIAKIEIVTIIKISVQSIKQKVY